MTIKIMTHQRGISLIELLVALLISSILILGVTQIFIDNKRTEVFQQQQTGNQESARFSEIILNEYLGKAGYRRAPDDVLENAFPFAAASSGCASFTEGSAITGMTNKTGLCLRYQPLVSGEPDCTGSATKAFNDTNAFSAPSSTALVVLALYYEPGTALDTGFLQCQNINTAGSSEPIQLVSNVADFRLSFGVGTASVTEKMLKKSGDRFVTSDSWSSSDGQIRAARYSILLASRANQRDGESAVLNEWIATLSEAQQTAIAARDERRIYQIAGSTQTLRNLMP
tara:strand:- start:5875 stop:6729 length:855 start_codon:yes stop_codon:yes gene_type:complete